MPTCPACDRYWTPTSLRPDGSCPGCSAAVAEPPSPPGSAQAARAPWHFKLLVAALAVYLGWRGIQGLGWVADHL